MGRGGNNSQHQRDKGRKSKGRMSYLRRLRTGGGGGGSEAKEDEFGQKYGDYVPAYGSKNSGRNFGGRGGRRREVLRFGMRGFLCTTNFKENECVREAFNILNEFCEDTENDDGSKTEQDTGSKNGVTDSSAHAAKVEEIPADEIKPEESLREEVAQSSTTASVDKDMDDDVDIDDALTSELQNLRSEKTVRKFQRADTGVTNVVFISTTIENPTELAHRIFEDVFVKKQTKSRHILRLLPIELTCNANNMEEIKSKAKEVIEKHMKTGYISFKIIANARLNGKFRKDDLIKSLAELVSQVNPLSFVDLSNPQYTIVAEVLKGTLCMGVVKDFTKFKKYNLLETGSNQIPAQVSENGPATSASEAVADKVDTEVNSDEATANANDEIAADSDDVKRNA